MTEGRRDGAIAFAIALVVFLAHGLSPIVTSFDSRWSIHTAASIAHRGDTDLDEYEPLLEQDEYYAIERRNGHLYNRYPIGTSLLAVLPVVTLDLAARLAPVPTTEELIAEGDAYVLESWFASLIVAVTAALMFSIGRARALRVGPAIALAAIFAFCTPAWSTASRALWQHGPSMLLLSIALLLLVLAPARPGRAALAALPLAFAFVVRPTNAIPLVLLTGYVCWRYRAQLLAYLSLAALVLVPFAIFNLANCGRLLPPYYLEGQPLMPLARVPAALAAHLVSPNRGLFVFSPILLLSLVGVACAWRRHRLDLLDVFLLLALAGHLVMISFFRVWWAGYSYGPRFFTDVMPLLVYFLIPTFVAMEEMSATKRRMLMAVAVALSAWSFFVHFRAATDWAVWDWNMNPISIDKRPARGWDWTDLQILRGLGGSSE